MPPEPSRSSVTGCSPRSATSAGASRATRPGRGRDPRERRPRRRRRRRDATRARHRPGVRGECRSHGRGRRTCGASGRAVPRARPLGPAAATPRTSVGAGSTACRRAPRRRTRTRGAADRRRSGESADTPRRPRSITAWFHADGRRMVEPRRGGLTEDAGRYLVGFRSEVDARPHAADVRVDRGHRLSEPQARDGGRRVVADPRQGAQHRGIARHLAVVHPDDLGRGAVERDGASRIAQTTPGSQHLGPRRVRQGAHVGEPPHEPLEHRLDPCDLGLLQHDLAHEHRERIGEPRPPPGGRPPGIRASPRPVPGEQGFPHLVARTRLLMVDSRGSRRASHDRDP